MRFSILIFLVILSLSITSSISSSNLLQNYDFESGSIDSWVTSGGSSIATASAELVHNGNYSIKVQHDKTSFYGFQQAISNIEGNKYYKISGYAASNSNNTAGYLIRLAWYTSNDATGTQISNTSDTEEVNQADGNWSNIEDIIQAPSTAKSTKIRLVLKSNISGINASAFFDDLSFEQVEDPAPTNTLSSTDTPTPTLVPTKTPTPTKKPTAIPAKLPTSKPTPISSESSKVNLPQSILGASATPSANPSPTPTKTENSGFSFTNIIFIAGGIVLILSGALVFTFLAKGKFKGI